MIPLLITAMPAVCPAIPAGTFTYRSTLGGASTGSSTIVVKRDGAATEIDENTAGVVSGISASATATLQLAPDLTPTAYTGSYRGGGQSAATTVSFSGNTANATGPAGAQTFSLVAPAQHFVVIDGALLAGFVALPAQLQAWNNAAVLAIAPIYGKAVTLTGAPAADARPPSLPATDAGITVTGSYPFTIWYDPRTLVPDELDVPSQQIVVTRVP